MFKGDTPRQTCGQSCQAIISACRLSQVSGIATNGSILCKLSQKTEKVGQSYVQGRHKMRVIASGDGISPPIKLFGPVAVGLFGLVASPVLMHFTVNFSFVTFSDYPLNRPICSQS
ncbi:hypothetical protein RB195_023723 [Necator americanus]|uniref:Uncharacterized protein n=1 Tax=Necator americanus TaxID=51031 RepID=A0ABR1EKE0_NECAM